MEAKNLADLYALPALEWEPIRARLESGLTMVPGSGGPSRHSCWLTTLDPDGGPHVTGVGALWVDGYAWFETGRATRKGRNVERDPRCALSLATEEFDLVVEGRGELITEPAVVADMAARWAQDWPCRVDESGIALTADFSAPSAGPPPWHVYRVTPHSATALATTGAGGATRWRF